MQISDSNLRAPKLPAKLTREQAVGIFSVRGSAPSAAKIATCFGISEKAVRDIWKARTWSRETCHLEPTRTVELKQIGRPKGCKDRTPRKKRVNVTSSGCSVDWAPPTTSTSRVKSVDDQLYQWGEEFWTGSKMDPFCDDWLAVRTLRIY